LPLHITSKVRRLLSELNPHTHEILQGASIAFCLKVLAAILSLAFNVLLARILGAEETGLYFITFIVITIGATISRLGFDNSIVRFTAASAVSDDWSAIHGLYRKIISICFWVSVLVATVIAGSAPFLAQFLFDKPQTEQTIRWLSLAIIPISLYFLHASFLRGLKRIADSVFILSVLLPLSALVTVGLLAPPYGLNGAIWGYILAASLTFAVGWLRWKSAVNPVPGNSKPHFPSKILYASAAPLFWVSLAQVVITSSSIFMLGIWVDSADVGVYGLANRLAAMVSFFLIAVNSIAAPKFAGLYEQKDMKALEKTVRLAALITTGCASPALLLALIMPDWIMGLGGPEFRSGGILLMILCIGQFFNAFTGSIGYLLIMCGREGLVRNNQLFCAVLVVCLNFFLIPRYHALGAALATASTIVIQNIISVVQAWTSLRIISIPFLPARFLGRPNTL